MVDYLKEVIAFLLDRTVVSGSGMEKDTVGFNQPDFIYFKFSSVSEINSDYIAYRLRKYRRQLEEAGLWKDILENATKVQKPVHRFTHDYYRLARYNQNSNQVEFLFSGGDSFRQVVEFLKQAGARAEVDESSGKKKWTWRLAAHKAQIYSDRFVDYGFAMDELELPKDVRPVFEIKGTDIIRLYSDYDKSLVEKYKADGSFTWDGDERCWTIPLTASTIDKLSQIAKYAQNLGYRLVMENKDVLTAQRERANQLESSKKDFSIEIEDLNFKLKPYPYQYAGIKFLDLADGRAILGDEMGCVDGESIVSVNRGKCARKYTLAQLYNKFHGGGSVSNGHEKFWDLSIPTMTASACENGILRLNEIIDVIDKGERETIELTIRSDKKEYKISVTPDHELLTKHGWVEAGYLNDGDTVAVNGKAMEYCPVCKKETEHATYYLSKFLGKCKPCIYRLHRDNHIENGKFLHGSDSYVYVSENVKNHPRCSSNGVLEHILVYEARLNNLSYESYVEKIKYNDLDDIKFVDAVKHVHHKNGNRSDNRIDNLELVSVSEHHIGHKTIRNIAHMEIDFAKIKSVKKSGKRHVYDIVMKDPYRNFVANGVVVHNCGKTLQAIGYCVWKKRKALVISPNSYKIGWRKEIVKFTNCSHQIMSKKKPEFEQADFTIINYEGIGKARKIEGSREYEYIWKYDFTKLNFDTLIVDESHLIKNSKSQRTKLIKELSKMAKYVILMSGTAIVNRPSELWPQLNIIHPVQFKNWYKFAMKYCGAVAGYGGHMDFKGATNLDDLVKTISPFYLRRTKAEVLPELPEKTYTDIEIEGITVDVEAETVLEQIVREKVAVSEATIPETIEHVENIIADGCKVIVFSDYVKTGEAIVEKFGDQCLHYKASLSPEQRAEAQERFQTDPNLKIFVATPKIAGVGLTLTAAHKVVFNDYPWTPGELLQAIDRTHRVGQKNAVNAYFMFAKGTIAEHIVGLLRSKLSILKKVLDNIDMTDEEKMSANDSIWKDVVKIYRQKFPNKPIGHERDAHGSKSSNSKGLSDDEENHTNIS